MDTDDLKRKFAANVKKYRKQLNLSQGVLGVMAETDERYIQNIEAGERTPGVIIAYRIAQALGVTVEDLLTK